ncbi:MAG: biotin transporter BioY [Nocardioidaceae bacterium]
MSSTTFAPAHPGRVLADLLPQRLARDIWLTGAGTALIVVLGQVAIPLPFTPVPLSLGTLAAVLTGAALGPARAAASMLVYLLAGVAGAPWFADQASGWEFASFGYIIGFVVAAVVVGNLARRGFDRSPVRMFGVMIAGSAVIYVFGVAWLMGYLDVGLYDALTLGVTPFLLGDAVKAAVAAGLLPGAWKLVDRVGRR